ncbi:MAG: methyltransferase domain-containing protein [Chloroflexota bacterium]
MSKKAVQSFFGTNAAAYATSKVHAKGASLQRLVELVRPEPQWSALDIATAAGHTAFIFAPHVAHVTATDLTPEMLAVASDLAKEKDIQNVSFEEADAEALPYDDNSFDLVTCRIAPHHFPHIDRFVSESFRVLRPGGVFALVDNVSPDDTKAAIDYNHFEKERDNSHVRCLTIAEWQQIITARGFTVQSVETADKEMEFASWVDRFEISDSTKSQLRELLLNSSGPLADFLRPASDEHGLRFYLTEALIVAKK